MKFFEQNTCITENTIQDIKTQLSLAKTLY
jgi:hypothetical protein